jgi:nucleoside 2-deoxyribosyltransferase
LAQSIYLAGPEVFFPDARDVLRTKKALCEQYGFIGLPPLDVDIVDGGMPTARAIFDRNVGLMRQADRIIANLTPFRGTSADSGTVFELGWFHGAGKPVHGYSNSAQRFDKRVEAALSPMVAGADGRRYAADGMAMEGFGLVDNLMIAEAPAPQGQVLVPSDGIDRPIDDLRLFEECLQRIATLR